MITRQFSCVACEKAQLQPDSGHNPGVALSLREPWAWPFGSEVPPSPRLPSTPGLLRDRRRDEHRSDVRDQKNWRHRRHFEML